MTLPPANPVKKRPKYNITTDEAHIMHAQPMVNGMTSASIVVLRPNRSMTKPIIRQLTMPPKFELEPTQEYCSDDTEKSY